MKTRKHAPQKYKVIQGPKHKSGPREWFWQLRTNKEKVLLSSPPFASEDEARAAALDDSRRRQVFAEDGALL